MIFEVLRSIRTGLAIYGAVCLIGQVTGKRPEQAAERFAEWVGAPVFGGKKKPVIEAEWVEV